MLRHVVLCKKTDTGAVSNLRAIELVKASKGWFTYTTLKGPKFQKALVFILVAAKN
jgi:hypothetical protein